MPHGDGTGPMGLGPGTGWGRGYCTGYSRPGYFGRGFFGRGWGYSNRHWASGGPGWPQRRWFGFSQPFEVFQGPMAEEDEVVFLRREAGSWHGAVAQYVRHPVLLASLTVVLLVPVGLLLARTAGFSPTTQTYTALETIAANLCWVPPLVGVWTESVRRRRTHLG